MTKSVCYGIKEEADIASNHFSLIGYQYNLFLCTIILLFAFFAVKCGCNPLPNPVVFSTTMQNNITSIGIEQELIFDSIRANVGNGYNIRHGTFTAPVDGVYEFSFSVYVEVSAGVGLDLKKNGVVIARTRSSQDGYGYFNMATNIVVTELKAGDDVWIEHSTADSNIIFGRNMTSFSGQLILPYYF
ncbi:hypothetical protein ACJMK2_015807 [Sinanodonta woodiana]|uniref:C1q domain-containing protein n=1 Tax=Sinanodonta woodiana TaxID=1069815 RepID=A0ABD3URL0_SINWO